MAQIEKRQIRSLDGSIIEGTLTQTTVISGSSQLDGTTIDSLILTNVEASGSFSGSYVGDGSGLSGVTSYTDSDTRRVMDTDNVFSSSIQIDHDQTTNYLGTEHYLQSAISIPSSQLTDTANIVYRDGTQTITGIKTFDATETIFGTDGGDGSNAQVEIYGGGSQALNLSSAINGTALSTTNILILKNTDSTVGNIAKFSFGMSTGTVTQGSVAAKFTSRTGNGTADLYLITRNAAGDWNEHLVLQSEGNHTMSGSVDLELGITSDSITKRGGTSTQFLKADGTIDSSTYSTTVGTVTSVGTTAPLSGTVSTSGNLSITQASTSTDGYLSQTDWDTFNNKSNTVGTVTSVAGGTALSSTGGATPSISLDNTAVAAGSYTLTDLTVDAQGRITAASSGDSGGGGTVTSIGITPGNLIDVADSPVTVSGSITIDVDLSELPTSTTNADGDFFAVIDTGNTQRKITKANVSLSGFSNDSGWTTNVGTVTSVGTTAPLSGTVSTTGNLSITQASTSVDGYLSSTDWNTFNNKTSNLGTVTSVAGGTGVTSTGGTTPSLSLNFAELTDMTGGISGTTELILQNGSTESRKAASEISLSNFDNNSGWTTNTGTVTSVGTTAPLSGTVTGTGNLSIVQATTSVSGYLTSTDWNTFNNKTSNTGTITSIATGTGLDGGTVTSGAITITQDWSEFTAVDGSLLVNTTDYMMVLDGTVEQKILLQNVKNSWFNNDAGFTTATGTMSSWDFYVDGALKEAITNGENMNFTGAGGITVTGTTVTNPTCTITHDNSALGAGSYGSTSDATKIDNITIDAQGHITAVTTGGTMSSWNVQANGGTVSSITQAEEVNFIDGLSTTVTHTVQANPTIQINHADTSTLSGAYGSTSNAVKFDTITVDAQGHVTGLVTGATGAGSMSSFNVQANGGTQVAVTNAEELNFINGTGTTSAVVNQTNPTVAFNLANTAVSAGSYTNSNITVDAQGRLTAASNGSGGSGTVTSVTAGTGMTQSGTSTINPTLNVIGGIGITANANDIALSSDRRSTSNVDVYDGNTSDYLFYDASVGMRFYTAGAEDMRLTDAGALHVDGDVIAFSSTISDERLKDNLIRITNPIEKIKKLNGYTYTWNAGSKKGEQDLGVSAQEMEKVFPEIVTEHEMPFIDEKIYKTVDYEKLTAVLIEGMKEQQTIIDKLTSRIEKLENI